MAQWHTPESARSAWADAPPEPLSAEDVDVLEELLEVAKGDVLAYKPLDDEENPPTRHRVAQLAQAKNMWNAGYATPSGNFDGGDGFGLTTFPLDWAIKQMLRPRSVFGGPVG